MRSLVISLMFGVLIVTWMLMTSAAQAATGDYVATAHFSEPCPSGIGVGIAYDGKNLWYSCYGWGGSGDLHRADPFTGVVSASYDIVSNGGLGALSYDATRHALWAGEGGGGVGGAVYRIDLDPLTNAVLGSQIVFNVAVVVGLCGLDDGLAFDANAVGDPNDDLIYYSNDCWVTTIRAFDLNGNLVDSFPFAGSGPHNSGLAVGGQLLYEADVFSSLALVVDKTTKALQFSFLTAVVGDPNFHPEDLECDTNTFVTAALARHVMWSKEAYAPMRAHAFEIPFGSCGVGGKPDHHFVCPFTPGYWKTHPDTWPVKELVLGKMTYAVEELLALLETPTKGDASMILAHQLIAAKLNVAHGSDPMPVNGTIVDADSLFGSFEGKLPYEVKTSSTIGQKMVDNAEVLDNYNNGFLTPDCQE